ncbi:MAG: RagB/SusD family nutrient uptake outer membrane protein [Dysgonamonadaceae bacterium]|nr:RagB/SusD family nutrient uptake outer membrane protein [Dysgonamonadaceae bacterium]
MKRINIYAVILLMLSVGIQSCELQSEQFGDVDPAIYPKTANDARDLVTSAAYRPFQNNWYDGVFGVATGYFIDVDIATDYGYCSWDDGGGWNRLMFAQWTPGDTRNVTNIWRDYLNKISAMTLTIDRIRPVQMDEKLKAQYIAELRCGRGFMAFIQWDMYGPIIVSDLENLKNPAARVILPRLSEEQTREYIVTELTEAAESLPYSYKKGDANYGRFTKGLCHTVLMKFYMQTKQWDKAIAEGRELMKAEYGYALMPSYVDLFTRAHEKNAETIFSVDCKEGTMENGWYPHVLPSDYVLSGVWEGGWGGYKMTWEFFDTFEPDDERTACIISEYTTNKGVVRNRENKGTDGGNCLQHGVIPLKYALEPVNGNACDIDFMIYRYADVLTLLAEAIVRHGNAVTPEAIDLLNQVRTRAKLAAYTAEDFAGPRDFLDKLLMERAHELWYEGCRRQDLIRDGSYIETMHRKCNAYGQPLIATENYTRFPIQESIIIAGQGIIEQNPGY